MGAPGSDSLLARVSLVSAADRGPATSAWSARPAVHPVLFAAPRDTRGDDAGPLLVRLQQPSAEFYEGVQVRHVAHRPPGVDALEEQHFCSKNIADPGQVALVQQRLADRPARAGAEPAGRLGEVPVLAEQIGPEVADHGVLPAGGQDLHDAELVTDRLPGCVGQNEPDAVVVGDAAGGGPDPP